MFYLFQMYVTSVFIWMLHMLHWLYTYIANYVLIVSPCFGMFQQVLLTTRSNLRASTRCTRCPCTSRRGPRRWSMQPAQHICMRAMLPPSLSHRGMCVVLSLALRHARCDPSLSHWSTRIGSLSHWGRRIVFPLSRMQLDGQDDAWGAAGGGVGRSSSRRRRLFPKK
jgi:hypothetical protein